MATLTALGYSMHRGIEVGNPVMLLLLARFRQPLLRTPARLFHMSAPTTQRVRIEVGDFAEGTMYVHRLARRADDQARGPVPRARLDVQDSAVQGERAPTRPSLADPLQVGGKVFATSSKCTHYGAPLIKGILSCEGQGRLVCPWHGAAFNVCTGDIEDAPGVGSLQSFKVRLSGLKSSDAC